MSVILKQQGMSQVKIAGVILAERKAARYGSSVWQNFVKSYVFIEYTRSNILRGSKSCV